MGAVIQRFPRTPIPEPMPVIMKDIIPVGLTRRRPLPEVIIQPGRRLCCFANSYGRTVVGIPPFRKIRTADDAVLQFFNGGDPVRPGPALGTHFYFPVTFPGGGPHHSAPI